MATFYPSLETIAKFKVPPTEGEQTLLDFLGKVLDDSYEVYFNPYLNGDRPDVLIMREGNGVMVIEVKDWNLDNFKLNEKKKWVLTPNGAIKKSPGALLRPWLQGCLQSRRRELFRHGME